MLASEFDSNKGSYSPNTEVAGVDELFHSHVHFFVLFEKLQDDWAILVNILKLFGAWRSSKALPLADWNIRKVDRYFPESVSRQFLHQISDPRLSNEI